MKISFDSASQYVDNTAIAPADMAAEAFDVYIDTVTPPVKKFSVPAAVVAAGTPNPDGSKHITVDPEKDLGMVLVPGSTLFLAADDVVNGQASKLTPILSFKVPFKVPGAPGNFSVA